MQYSFGAYRFDPARYALTQAGTPVPLRPQACELLAYLLRHRDRVVPKEELLAQVWAGQSVGDGVLHACVLAVRTALHDTGRTPAVLHTVRGRGYRFVALVEVGDLAIEAPPQDRPLPLPAGSATPAAPAGAVGSHTAGEYKPVSVLCCGLAAAPSPAAWLGPEELYHHMQTVVGLAQEVLHRYAGTLLPPMSAGVLAVFGAPVAQEDHARRAVLAALALHQRLRASAALRPQHAGAALAVRMGVHSGLVVVGGLGHDPQWLPTVVGAPAHLALQLQQQAVPETILLSTATYQLVQAEVRVDPCGTLVVDGSPTPMPVYTVQGLVGRHAGVAGRGVRDQSPFVGRAWELARLDDHLTAAMAGQGQVVSLVGAPGMGKTRLLAEFCRRMPRDQVTVYTGQCLSYGQSTPYLLVRDLLQQVCGLVEGDTAAVHTAAVQQRLHASGMTADADVALLLQLLDLPVAPEALTQRSPEGRQVRTFALLRHLLLDAAQQRPLVLVVENLHWSDPTSASWLASLVERVAAAAVLLLATYRPGYQPAWSAHVAVTQVVVPPLRAPESRTIVQATLGTVSLPKAQLQAIVAQAGGNPFFVEELAWHAKEQGTPGALPETVHAVLAARIDWLPPEAKRLLQVAAVIGPDVPFPLLHAMAELPEDALYRALAHLQTAEFLYETRLLPEHAYTFKHVLTQEVAYGSLLLERRRALHAHIVEALEALAGDRGAAQVERLAHHALRGEVWAKALAYCRQAGEKAMARSAHRDAVGYYEQALGAVAHLPAQRQTHEQAIDLRLALRSTLWPSSDFGRILAVLREAEALAAALADAGRLGHVSSFLAIHLCDMGAYAQAIAPAQRALALGTARGDRVLRGRARHILGRAYEAQGDHQRAIDLFRPTTASLQGAERQERFGHVFMPAVTSRAWLAVCHAELGTFAEGRGFGEEGLRIAEGAAHHNSLMVAARGLGLLTLRQGDLPRALPLLERAVRLCQDVSLPMFFPQIAAALGAAYTLAGRVAVAVPLLTQALEQNTATGRGDFQVGCYLALGEAHLQAGRLEEAHTLATRALAFARARQERGNEAYALRLLGTIVAHRHAPEATPAETHYRHALALAEELGLRPLQAHCHRGLGTLYAKTGQRELPRAELSTAIEMYQAMEMTFWLPETQAALAQVEAG